MTDLSQISPCLLGSGFLMSSVFTMMTKHKSSVIADFEATLSPNQLKVYDEIKEERCKLYFKGIALGTLVGALYLYFNSGRFGNLTTACIFTLIVMGTMTFFYKLSPKSKWMVEHLTDAAQVERWNAIYKMYAYKYYWGFFLGMLGYLLIGYTLTSQTGQQAFNYVQDVVSPYVPDFTEFPGAIGNISSQIGDQISDLSQQFTEQF